MSIRKVKKELKFVSFGVGIKVKRKPLTIPLGTGFPAPIVVEFPLIDARMSRFYDELGYTNRQSITWSDFGVLFDDEYSSWYANESWDTLNESRWVKCLYRTGSYYEVTITNLTGVDVSEAVIGVGGISKSGGTGGANIRISYTPISTGIETDIWIVDGESTESKNHQEDLLQLLTTAGLSTTIAVGDKIKATNFDSAHNQFVIGVKGIV